MRPNTKIPAGAWEVQKGRAICWFPANELSGRACLCASPQAPENEENTFIYFNKSLSPSLLQVQVQVPDFKMGRAREQQLVQLQDIAYLAAFSATGLTERERRAAWGRLISREKWKQSRRRGGGRRRRAAAAAAAEARGAGLAAVGGGGAGHGGAEVLQQVRMDVARAFHWDVCRAWGAAKRASSLSALALVLDGVFPAAAQQAFPFYVQGCHCHCQH